MENQLKAKVKSSSELEKVFPHSHFVPYYPNVPFYQCTESIRCALRVHRMA